MGVSNVQFLPLGSAVVASMRLFQGSGIEAQRFRGVRRGRAQWAYAAFPCTFEAMAWSVFFRVPEAELLERRNDVFVERGIPALRWNGFSRSPFRGTWFGKDDTGDYEYELCRLSNDAQLEIISVYISSGDTWIKIHLNVFALRPDVHSLERLEGVDGLKFHLPPNSISKMRLRIDDYRGMPLFRTKEHKIGRYHSQSGFERALRALGDLIEHDLSNIRYFVERWFEMHHIRATTWEGEAVPDPHAS